MRKTVYFIRFALCIAIGLVGSGVFAAARAISSPIPLVEAQEIQIPVRFEYSSASLPLASAEETKGSTAISASISSQKITEIPTPVEEREEESPRIEETADAPGVLHASITATPVSSLPQATPTPHYTYIPTPSPLPSTTPTPVSEQAVPTGLNAEVLFNMVNSTRTQAGLPAFEKNDTVCSMATVRAPEIQNEIYGSSYMHAGFQARARGNGMNENIISIMSEQQALNWWLNSPVHRSSIYGNYKYSCVACSGNSCTQIFSN